MTQGKPFRLSVKALVRDGQGRVLVLRRASSSRFNAGRWDFPGGKMDGGEGIEEALLRETREETGLAVTLTRVLGAGESETPEFRVAYLFFEAVVDDSSLPDSSDIITIALSPEHDAVQWIAPAAMTAIGLCPQYHDFVSRLAPAGAIPL